jgi:hypothetical protein
MRAFWGGVVVLCAVVLAPQQSEAQPLLQQRCAVDSLDTTQAAQRIEWARKCGLIKNVGSPTYGFDTGIPAGNGGSLWEYMEADPNRNPQGNGAFSGPSFSFEVNYAYINSLFLSGATNTSTDAWGYQKWERPSNRRKARPIYPTFGTTANIGDATNRQLFPLTSLADCNLYTTPTGGVAAVTNTYYVNGYCEASCYGPDEQVLFSNGPVAIVDAVKALREDLMTLKSDSTLDNVKLQQGRTYSYTVETRDSEHTLYVIKTQSGGQLRVTNEHPIIQGEGRMVQAQTLKVGDDLVKADGTPDQIVSVEKASHFGKVYNLRPVSSDLVSNVLVAQGFLVGSSNFQNDDVNYINRIILYRGTPSALLP